MPPTTRHSSRFTAAAEAEIKRLEKHYERVMRKHTSIMDKAREVLEEASGIEAQIHSLQRSLDRPETQMRVKPVSDSGPVVVGGRELRIEMMRYVAANERLHYTSWGERLKRGGVSIAGTEPTATLLTALGRGPLVRPVGMRTGDYIADPELVDEWSAKVERLEREVAAAGPIPNVDKRVRDLTAARERLIEARDAYAVLGSNIGVR